MLKARLVLLMSFLVIACGQTDPLAQPGVIRLSEAFTADFELTDHHGAPATDERFAGKPMFIYFGFATCPDVCPAALSVMSASLEAMGPEAEKIQPLFITIDPERDTAEALKAHLAFDPRILGLTGTAEQAEQARKNLKLYAQKRPMPDSALEYTMDHQSMFYIVDSDGAVPIALKDSMLPEDIADILSEFIK